MEQDNIIWKEMQTPPTPEKSEEIRGEIEPCKMASYPSLYLELRDKCNPKNFLVPYDKEKVDIANDLFIQLLRSEGNDVDILNTVKEQAVQKLGIVLSTKKLYEELLDYCDPQKFMNPYNHSAIQQANHYYSLIHEYRNQLDKLEALHKDISSDELLARYYSNREKEREEERAKLRKEKLKLEQEMDENRRKGIALIFCLVLLLLLLFAAYIDIH